MQGSSVKDREHTMGRNGLGLYSFSVEASKKTKGRGKKCWCSPSIKEDRRGSGITNLEAS